MPTEHIVTSYENELDQLDEALARMGGLTEKLLSQAIESLSTRNPDLAAKIIGDDKTIDKIEEEITEQAISMIARRQPMAQDLRQIVASLKMSSDLERIGDLGKNIAKRTLTIYSEKQIKPLVSGLKHMSQFALTQINDVLDSYSQRDPEKAVKVWMSDEELDSLYNSLFREVLTYMMEDPRNISQCSHLLFIAKNIERIGDHATNIAELVYYFVNGTALTDDRPKGAPLTDNGGEA